MSNYHYSEAFEEVMVIVGDNCDIDDVFTESQIIEYVSKAYDPESVFPESELIEWAENNGYVLEE